MNDQNIRNDSNSNSDADSQSETPRENNQSQERQRDGRSKGGFAQMKRENPERLSEIARQGGQEAHKTGAAHEWDSREAAQAGSKGGRS